MDKLLQAVNRFAGIVVWVGTWNLILLVVKEEDPLGNTLLLFFGVLFWYATGEFERVDTIQNSIPVNIP